MNMTMNAYNCPESITIYLHFLHFFNTQIPDSKVHGAIMEPAWVLSAPGGPDVGPMNLAIWDAVGNWNPSFPIEAKEPR